MRFYRAADDSTLELRHPRSWVFLFGPFYLLWLKLWAEAVVVAVVVWAVTHWAAVLTRNATGMRSALDIQRAWAALDVIRAAGGRTPAADQAFRELVAMTLPVYAAGFALLGTMVVVSVLFPRYLRWRFGLRGWRLVTEGTAGVTAPAPGAGTGYSDR